MRWWGIFWGLPLVRTSWISRAQTQLPTEPHLLILHLFAEMNTRLLVSQEPESHFLIASLISLQLVFHFVAGKNTKQKQNASLILYQLYFFWPDHSGKHYKALRACVLHSKWVSLCLGSGKRLHTCLVRVSKYLWTWMHIHACAYSCTCFSLCGPVYLCLYIYVWISQNS